jgi:fructose-1,6-bisphosphatase I / sedoheptulose-1,7-bisphosphatase
MNLKGNVLVADEHGGAHLPGTGRKTLTRFTIEKEHENRDKDPTGDFSGLLNAVATAVKVIGNQVGKGALAAGAGAAGTRPGPDRERGGLDVISSAVMVGETEWTGHLAGMVSVQMPGVRAIPPAYRRGKYLLAFDPLDGAGDLDVNITVGTIFSILRSPRPGAEPSTEDFLQPGTAQVCAGFALYGPATMLVLTTGSGVDGFTLDRDIGAFVLTHPRMRIPPEASEFAINSSNERHWEPPVRRYVQECLAGKAGARGQDFSMRWTASLVAEVFRILTRGGVFLDPADGTQPGRTGRLRLLQAANPVSFLVEQAGGLASTGRGRVMELTPGGLHQRVPLIFGSRAEVERIERYHRDRLEPARLPYDASLFNARSLFRD